MSVWKAPATRSTRTASPRLAATALSCASRAALTVLSTDTTTWLLTVSAAQAVPGMSVALSSREVAAASSAVLCLTRRGVAPAARTELASAPSVIVTTIRPVFWSRYVPPDRAPNPSARVLARSALAVVAAWAVPVTSRAPTSTPAAPAAIAAWR
jgi:hypothetical protein